MRNFKQNDGSIDYTNPSSSVTILSGAVIVFPAFCGIAGTNILPLQVGGVDTEGVFELPKENPLVIAQGAEVFWDATNQVVTKTSAGNSPLGYAWTPGASTATTIWVCLEGKKSGSGAQAASVALFGNITNLGTAGASYDQTALNLILAAVETRLDNLETKQNATLQSLKDAGQMA